MNATNVYDRIGQVSTWVRRVVDESGATVEQPTAPSPAQAAAVATIMTRTTYCVRPEVAVETVVALLLEHRLSGVPVVDADGRPVGIVSKTDLLRHLHENGDSVDAGAPARGFDDELATGFHATAVHGTAVGDVMMPIVFAIEQDADIALAAALMAGEGIHRLPVLAGDGTVVGILSALDIVRWVAEGAGYNV